MSELATFTLVPFEPLPAGVALSITGTVLRADDQLSISYLMSGDVGAVALPPSNTTHERQDRLWEKTCFEFFLTAGAKKTDSDPYWEFNFSPTGAWNVFALESYRQGLSEATAFTSVPFSVSQSSEGLRLEVSVDLSRLQLSDPQWLLGVSAVCVLAGGEETFWAIAHPTPKADFHSPGSFTLQLSP
ncbi:MAG: DOMON-like domain-containing protein [Cyanobacteria bacterium J06598_1]